VSAIQIKHRWTDAVLFTFEATDEQQQSGMAMRHALEAAVEAHANLAGAYLAHANLAGAYLAHANLADANLADAYLAHANLADANLADANLAHAYLAHANLADANLADAYLAHANLADANLADANLAHANLAHANLADANLAGAKWRDGITIQRAPLQLFGLMWPVHILDTHMQIGCELHTLSDWACFDDERIARMDGRDALRFWRAHKDALLALADSDGRGVEQPVAEAAS
jgi:hypothetical protein